MIHVPRIVSNKARAAGASSWLADLPALVASLEEEWSIRVGPPFDGATEAFVAEATCEDGTAAVLKVVVPRAGDAAENEIAVLRLVDGQGCARLWRADAERGVLLLERLGRSLFEVGLPMRQRHEILCDAASRVWRPAPGCGLPTGAAKGRWLAESIATLWEELDRPCSERAVDHSLACAARRIEAHDDERAVVVHGDVHQWNAMEADDGFKLIDPDGLLAEAEYDLGVILREDPVELLADDPRQRTQWLATRSGRDATASWEWGVVERVSTGLLCTQIDLQPSGRQMLAAADRLAAADPFAE